jgi:hypothetical protein
MIENIIRSFYVDLLTPSSCFHHYQTGNSTSSTDVAWPRKSQNAPSVEQQLVEAITSFWPTIRWTLDMRRFIGSERRLYCMICISANMRYAICSKMSCVEREEKRSWGKEIEPFFSVSIAMRMHP